VVLIGRLQHGSDGFLGDTECSSKLAQTMTIAPSAQQQRALAGRALAPFKSVRKLIIQCREWHEIAEPL
jgi:hypothetical protein